jgi:DNA invertase Pin-like site-specific DNA recombinase
MKKVGYARVSTVEQNIDLQHSALRSANCDLIYRDEGASGATSERNGLKAALKALNPGDKLIVWRLDRLGRSLLDLVRLLDSLSCRKVEFQSLTEQIDTVTAGGRLVFHMMAALAEFERHLIRERTVAGMEVARQNGSRIGRPKILSDMQRREIVRAIVVDGKKFADVADRYNVHCCTVRRIVASAAASMQRMGESRYRGDDIKRFPRR